MEKKRVVLKPIAYIGIVLTLSGILVPRLLNIRNSSIQLLALIVSVVGFALILKGRKEE